MAQRFHLTWALLIVAMATGSVTCFDSVNEDEIIRLASILGDMSDWHPPHIPGEARPLRDPYQWPAFANTDPDRVDHRFYRAPEADVYDDAESATLGVAGLGRVQDRESLESDVETISDELTRNPDERQPVHRAGLTPPYRPPSGHPDSETLDAPQHRPPFDTSSLFQHHFNTFFNTPLETGFFGSALPGFGFFDLHANRPWWKGDNVCTEREEKEEDINSDDNQEVSVNDGAGAAGSSFHGFSSFNLNVESCAEKQHKYVCTSIKNVNGRKRTEKITRQCCHGFGRPRSGPPNAQCQKLDLQSMEETAERLGAKEFIATLKKSGLERTLDNEVTLFLVLDGPYSTFAEQMWENNLVAFDPTARAKRAIDFASMTARDVILGHTVNGSYHIEDISNEQLLRTELPGANIRINIYPRGPSMMAAREQQHAEHPYRYTANCAPLIKLNRVTEHGIAHVVDRVLVPARRTLMDIIEGRDDMTLMRTFLEMTGLDKMLREQGDDKHFTVFAPNDDAFLKLDKDIRRKLKAGNGCATNILKNHILDITFCSLAAVNGVKTSTYNMLNEKLEFEYAMVGKMAPAVATTVNPLGANEPIGDGDKKSQRLRINGMASIEESDVVASNGVLHIIDTVLPTDSGMPISNTLTSHNLTIFKQLVADAGLEDEFDGMTNKTFFIPTDQAFEQTETGRYWIRQLKEHPESLRDNAALKEFLEYHVVEPLIKTCELEETTFPTKAGQHVRVNLYTTNPVFTTVMNRATVNCARLTHFDEETCGSVVHEIDKVLDVPKQNLMETLSSNADYSMFLRLVSETNLTELLASEADSGFTLLVPKNDVFLEVNAWYQETLKNKDELERVIRAHILPNVICCTGIVPSEWPFVRTTETIGHQQLKLNRNRRPQVQNAGITKCDVVARNGIIHEINDVISVQPPRGAAGAAGGNAGGPFPSFGNIGRPLTFWFK
ncbi:periostin isoform X1 [Anopheles bellator]|uniref:periostin isoform X1 n=1 Tax=Anopheles bellator TaxID=139047 RepID=UPI0026496E20|nr:periostin isoform X1 [Anopheles bellator]